MMATCFQRSALIEAAPLQEEILLFHPQKNVFCVLNRTASFLWSCLADSSTAEQLVEKLSQHFEGVAAADVLQDVHNTLRQLQSLDFIVVLPQ
ncbi:MAG: PqqD family protein [Candidatus Tectimicrobiota bacterium]